MFASAVFVLSLLPCCRLPFNVALQCRLQSHFVVAINIVEVEKKEDDVFFFWLVVVCFFVLLCVCCFYIINNFK